MRSPGARRIVVVDDDSAVLRTVHRQLELLGWDVHPAETAGKALSLLERLGQVDAVLTDVNMPVMDGESLCHEVVQRFPRTAVVLMSGDEHPAAHPAAGRSAPTLLRKPFTMQALAAALETACNTNPD